MAEKFIAKWFPKKHNVVIATFASYIGIYGLINIARGNPEPVKPVKKSKKVKTVEPVAAASANGYVAPTVDNIGEWINNPNNLTQWEKSLQ